MYKAIGMVVINCMLFVACSEKIGGIPLESSAMSLGDSSVAEEVEDSLGSSQQSSAIDKTTQSISSEQSSQESKHTPATETESSDAQVIIETESSAATVVTVGEYHKSNAFGIFTETHYGTTNAEPILEGLQGGIDINGLYRDDKAEGYHSLAVTINENITAKGVKFISAPLDISAFKDGVLHFAVKPPEGVSDIMVKIEGPGFGPDLQLSGINIVLVAEKWNTVQIPIAQFNTRSLEHGQPFNMNEVTIPFAVILNWGEGTYLFDDIYLLKEGVVEESSSENEVVSSSSSKSESSSAVVESSSSLVELSSSINVSSSSLVESSSSITQSSSSVIESSSSIQQSSAIDFNGEVFIDTLGIDYGTYRDDNLSLAFSDSIITCDFTDTAGFFFGEGAEPAVEVQHITKMDRSSFATQSLMFDVITDSDVYIKLEWGDDESTLKLLSELDIHTVFDGTTINTITWDMSSVAADFTVMTSVFGVFHLETGPASVVFDNIRYE